MITQPTPMMMPSDARSERLLLCASAWTDHALHHPATVAQATTLGFLGAMASAMWPARRA